MRLVAVLAIVLFVDAAYARRSGEQSVQSLKNLNFVKRADRLGLARALDMHPKVRPPLYPILLWACSRLGLPPRRVNEALFGSILLMLAVWARSRLGAGAAAYLLALYTVAAFNYVNMYQTTAEVLFAALSMAILLLLEAHGRSRTWGSLFAVAAASSALCVTRYFGLFFVPPLIAAHLLLAGTDRPRRRLAQLAAFTAVSLAPAALWMRGSVAETGYLSGADRFAPRELPGQVEHWRQLTGVAANLTLWTKTIFVDFFSLHRYAALSVVTRPYRASAIECAVAAVTVAGAALAVAVSLRAWRGDGLGQRASLPLQFFTAYTLVTLVLWSVGNNDPLNTRFLYPSYVFLLVVAFQGYELLKRRAPSWQGLPLRAAYVALLLVHVWRDFEAVALPYR